MATSTGKAARRCTDKTEVSYAEHLQIMGLLLLGKTKVAELNDLEGALRTLTGEKESWGHCGDAIYGGDTAEQLLDKLGLTVAPPVVAEAEAGND